MHMLSRFSRNTHGVAAVEFAIIFPCFICMLFSMVGWGLYLNVSHSIQQIAAETARAAVAGLSATERTTLATGYVSSQATAGFALIDKQKLTVQVADDNLLPNQFTVKLTYDASGLPIWNLMTFAMPDAMIVRSTTIRIGGL
ncbi:MULTISPECIES: TadE/TadG family type IV pilus assembly protein [unclassified Rhizobium]|uniref:TadE/TadG family type IV pilus assembly protein n=1 Tax=unclassified Rhizobium TaxID=2613769 RepID=UPI001ADAA4F8|nr:MULTISPECIES: TadE/TadG family type IV pilus assembly protein [unclassified Rhizobium]MBO9102039.1 pilus assembly protein [Rhizobium sp. L58/93]MBO9170762.1 pilus assembly protein [Rhizobium sp. L245/93]MBO9186700.1 pilus assembly protein [Rhizobium sp. E27B/91]QXZ86141.1 pilus assembly protein [Rhizobium sp. K1/93]QXZ92403.1 pilus assembly protein [Rhizobium sp. K15/93]